MQLTWRLKFGSNDRKNSESVLSLDAPRCCLYANTAHTCISLKCHSNVKISSFIYFIVIIVDGCVFSYLSGLVYDVTESRGGRGSKPITGCVVTSWEYQTHKLWLVSSWAEINTLYGTKDILIICNKQQQRTHVGSNHFLVYISHILWKTKLLLQSFSFLFVNWCSQNMWLHLWQT